jgi:hypothetical protein
MIKNSLPRGSLRATLRVTSHLLESLEYSSISIRAKREKGCMDPEEAEDGEELPRTRSYRDPVASFLTQNSPAQPIIRPAAARNALDRARFKRT